MSAVFLLEVLWGRGKSKKGKRWYPTHPRHTVATLPHTFQPRPPTHLEEIHSATGGTNCGLCDFNPKNIVVFSACSLCAPPCGAALPRSLGISDHPVGLWAWGFTVIPLCSTGLALSWHWWCRPHWIQTHCCSAGGRAWGRTCVEEAGKKCKPSVWPCKSNFHAHNSESYSEKDSWLSTADCHIMGLPLV